MTDQNKTSVRQTFLENCSPATVKIQRPILDPYATRGHPNPAGLGHAQEFSQRGSWGQSSVLFSDLKTYRRADETGVSPYGGAEYGVPLTPEADAVCRKIADLHKGCGAVICPSGLSAITTTIAAVSPQAVLIPDNVYAPLVRYLNHKRIAYYRYPAGASADEFKAVLSATQQDFPNPKTLIAYIEAPGSGTFEIPDIDGIVTASRDAGLRTVMDNTWASHVRFKPIGHGVDIVIQATTKYEGGFGDTPSGVVIAKHQKDFQKLAEELRISGNGAVAPTTCARLFNRINSTEERLNQHAATARTLIDWFQEQPFVAEILSPTLTSSPYHGRFKEYFGKGNGLFSVVFRPDLPESKVAAFADALNLFWVAESWGGHVSLVLPVHAQRETSPSPSGHILRFHAGLEDAHDLLLDLEQAARRIFFPEVRHNIRRRCAQAAISHL